MPQIQIKLNLEDLEKLLKNKNGNIDLEISQSIANTFAKKHLKGMVTEKMIAEAQRFMNSYDFNKSLENFKQEIENRILAKLGIRIYNKDTRLAFTSFDPESFTIKTITKDLHYAIEKRIDKMVDDAIKSEKFQNEINKYIDNSLTHCVIEKIKEKVNKALEIIKKEN